MLLELKRIQVPPRQRVVLQNVTWQELETILEELGEHRAARIAYERGMLEIMTPLPEHEFGKEIVGDLVKALLAEIGEAPHPTRRAVWDESEDKSFAS